MNITEILDEKNILLSVDAESKFDVFNILAQSLEETGVITNKELFVKDVLKREEEYSTGIGFGVAIPHAKSKYVTKASIAIAKLTGNILYEAMDEEPIKLMFMIAVPINNNNDHLKILSMLAKKIMDEDLRNALKEATTKEEIIKTLKVI